jgi:hypothetical protein
MKQTWEQSFRDGIAAFSDNDFENALLLFNAVSDVLD